MTITPINVGAAPNDGNGDTARAAFTIHNDNFTDPTNAAAFSSVALGRKNLLINDFSVNQKVVSGTVVLSAGVYGHDRFKAGSGGCTYTFSKSAGVTTIIISAGTLLQIIEGSDMPSSPVVLSWTGSAQGRINGGTFGASGAVTATTTGGSNTTVEFNTGTLSKPQLELGDTVTDFEFVSPATQLARCQPYFQKSYDLTVVPGTITTVGNHKNEGIGTASPLNTVFYITQLRATPTVTFYSPATGAIGKVDVAGTGDVDANSGDVGENSLVWFPSATPALGINYGVQYTLDAEL